MKIEHFALNVAEPTAMAAWYGEHLGLRVVRHIPEPNQTHFLADSAGTTVMEIYRNPAAPVPDYSSMDPLVLHVAFISENATIDAARLTDAGARLVDELNFPDGSLILMLRDPWGLALQLCQRAHPLL